MEEEFQNQSFQMQEETQNPQGSNINLPEIQNLKICENSYFCNLELLFNNVSLNNENSSQYLSIPEQGIDVNYFVNLQLLLDNIEMQGVSQKFIPHLPFCLKYNLNIPQFNNYIKYNITIDDIKQMQQLNFDEKFLLSLVQTQNIQTFINAGILLGFKDISFQNLPNFVKNLSQDQKNKVALFEVSRGKDIYYEENQRYIKDNKKGERIIRYINYEKFCEIQYILKNSLPIIANSFSKLTILTLNYCSIQNFNILMLENFPGLIELDVCYNKIKSLEGFNSFSVTVLKADENDITDFNSGSFNNVREASFKLNSIDSIQNINFGNVKKINFSYNRIKNIDEIYFQEIRILIISNNDIMNISKVKWGNKMKVVDLADNPIEIIDGMDVANLEILYLEGIFTAVPPKIIQSIKKVFV